MKFKVLVFLSLLFFAACTGTQTDTDYKVVAPKTPKEAAPNSEIPIGYPEEKSHNTEQYDLIVENDFHSAINKPLSTFGIDVDNASYSNTRRFLTSGQMPPRDAVRIEEFINYFNYDYEQPDGEHPFKVATEIADCPWNTDHRLVHIGLKAKEVPMTKVPPSNLVFLIDVSGSMDQPNKLPLLKQALKMLIKEIRDQDRIAMVVYAGASGVVLESMPGTKRRVMRNALAELQAGGSTNGAAGIAQAYGIAQKNFIEGGNNRVILATDGDFNVGVSSDAELVQIIERERKKGIFLSVLGFGTGNLKDAKMEKIADNGNGNYFYIDNPDEARKVLVDEITKTIFTLAKDVKLQVEFNPAQVKEYRLIGYENRVLNDEDFNNDEKDSGDMGAGHTVTALYEVIPAGSESTMTSSVDDLKYQDRKIKNSAGDDPDLMTIKIRYKHPDSDTSIPFELTTRDTGKDLAEASENFKFSAAVAGFGMLLRDSKYKGGATYDNIEALAIQGKGKDEKGYREEFIRLIDLARSFQSDSDIKAEK